jgi:predicted nucleic acid-binding protein
VGTVAFDASIIIGFLDPADALHAEAVHRMKPWLTGGNTRLVPASVYAEILVWPLRLRRADQIEEYLAKTGMEVVPIDRSVARRAAQLRAEFQSLRLPDALALATALERDAILLTLDARVRRIAEEAQRPI